MLMALCVYLFLNLPSAASIDDHRLQVTIPLISAQTKVNCGDTTMIDGGGGGGGGHL